MQYRFVLAAVVVAVGLAVTFPFAGDVDEGTYGGREVGDDRLGEGVGEDLGCFAAREVGQVGQGSEECLFGVGRAHRVEVGVRRWIVGFRRVVCGGWFLVFEGGNDVGFGLVIVNAGFVYFSIRLGRVDEPEFCALARVYELGADKDGTVGKQG